MSGSATTNPIQIVTDAIATTTITDIPMAELVGKVDNTTNKLKLYVKYEKDAETNELSIKDQYYIDTVDSVGTQEVKKVIVNT